MLNMSVTLLSRYLPNIGKNIRQFSKLNNNLTNHCHKSFNELFDRRAILLGKLPAKMGIQRAVSVE